MPLKAVFTNIALYGLTTNGGNVIKILLQEHWKVLVCRENHHYKSYILPDTSGKYIIISSQSLATDLLLKGG